MSDGILTIKTSSTTPAAPDAAHAKIRCDAAGNIYVQTTAGEVKIGGDGNIYAGGALMLASDGTVYVGPYMRFVPLTGSSKGGKIQVSSDGVTWTDTGTQFTV